MTGIDDDPDECLLRLNRLEPLSQLIINNRVGDLARPAVPGANVTREKDLIEAVGFRILGVIALRLLAAVPGHEDDDLIARLRLLRETMKFLFDVRSCRQP